MKYRASISEAEEQSEINISPLIDMVFILLIFFIVTTVFVEESGMMVDKPAAGGASLGESTSVVLTLTAQGNVYHEGNDITVSGVQPTVRRAIQASEDTPVILQIEKSVKAARIVQVMDAAKMGGAMIVSISTKTGGG